MKATLLGLSLCCIAASAQANSIYSTLNEGEDIYSTVGDRDIYSSEFTRERLYVSRGEGGAYSTADKREGLYVTDNAPPPQPSSEERLLTPQVTPAGSVYNGYIFGE